MCRNSTKLIIISVTRCHSNVMQKLFFICCCCCLTLRSPLQCVTRMHSTCTRIWKNKPSTLQVQRPTVHPSIRHSFIPVCLKGPLWTTMSHFRPNLSIQMYLMGNHCHPGPLRVSPESTNYPGQGGKSGKPTNDTYMKHMRNIKFNCP